MLRVGLTGLGGIAQEHCNAIEGLDTVQVVAVADFIEANRRKFMDRYEIPRGYATHTEMLQDPEVDAVGVILGHQLHHRLTIDALNAGKHVLVEKPMALSLQQCDEMIAAARANGVKLMVGHTNHFLSTNLKAKEILDSGALGPLITVVTYACKNWGYAGRRPQYRSRYHGGGQWLSNGVHVMDRLTWFMNSQAVSVAGTVAARSHYQAGDDGGVAFVRYKNGLAGVGVCIAYRDGAPNGRTDIICANGSLKFQHRFVDRTKPGEGLWIGRGDRWEKIEVEPVTPSTMTYEWQRFAEAIDLGVEVPVPGVYGRHIVEILLAAEESEITRREVRLPGGTNWFSQTDGEPVITKHSWM